MQVEWMKILFGKHHKVCAVRDGGLRKPAELEGCGTIRREPEYKGVLVPPSIAVIGHKVNAGRTRIALGSRKGARIAVHELDDVKPASVLHNGENAVDRCDLRGKCRRGSVPRGRSLAAATSKPYREYDGRNNTKSLGRHRYTVNPAYSASDHWLLVGEIEIPGDVEKLRE